MSEALFGFLGVIVGAVVSLLGEQLVTRREREARQALREQERKDRRDAFQRETLLAVQDAIADVGDALWHDLYKKLALVEQLNPWPTRGPGQPLPEDWTEADGRVSKLAGRVFDMELLKLLGEHQEQSGLAVTALDRDTALDRIDAVSALSKRINARIGTLLADLF